MRGCAVLSGVRGAASLLQVNEFGRYLSGSGEFASLAGNCGMTMLG